MKIKIDQLVCFIIFLGFPTIVISQNVDEIIAKHIAAHGGAEKWNEVESLKITGKFTAFSLENDYTAYKTKAGSYYGDLYLGEINVIESLNNEIGWTIDPWQEMDYARNLNSGEINVFQQKAEFFTPFFNYKEKGHMVEYSGKDTLDGIEVFTLKLTRANGKIETWYLNTTTYLEYICESEWVDFAIASPSEAFFEDFRTVNGLVIPFFIERTFWQRDRILQIENVEINPKIDESIFEMPRREEIKKLKFLEGNWDVKVEAWTRRGTWHNLGNTISDISFVSTNLLQENISYERNFAISKTINYTFNEVRNNYRISVFNDLSSTFNVFEGEFNDTAFVFNNTSIRFGKDEIEGMEQIQYSISSIEENSFILERKSSMDKGTSWTPKDKFTYTRKEE